LLWQTAAPAGDRRYAATPRLPDSGAIVSSAAMPDFALEMSCKGLVCGVDEAGRGPLAGPVVAAAVVLDRRRLPRALRHGLDDSKKLAPEVREEFAHMLEHCAEAGAVRIGIGAASVIEIDRRNILQATLAAMCRAVAALDVAPEVALVDGNVPPPLPCPVRTVIGGDGLSLSIAAASVIAKVTRDRLMRRLALRYGGYGWETNVGYGTREHHAALQIMGLTPHHRRSFAPVQLCFGFESSESLQQVDSQSY
jgi:ribonuclease HII